ncbi:MAG: hypothetical protein H7X80_10255 [bacterium]|nr:hypothetical protein [Candidatus Kapabacteria bacterium]
MSEHRPIPQSTFYTLDPSRKHSLDGALPASPVDGHFTPGEFAEPIPEYLRDGYRALMLGDAQRAIDLWENLYARFPSAEVCGHLARAHFYQTYFLGHGIGHPQHGEHIIDMRRWAERALELNPNSSIGHAMLAVAVGRLALISGTQKQIILKAWEIRYHAERAILIDNHWAGHFVLGTWHREVSAVHPGLRALANVFFVKIPPASFAESLRHFEEILRQYPDNNMIYAEMAYTYVAMGDMRTACEMYDRCVTMPLFRHPIARYLTEAAIERFGRRIDQTQPAQS